MHSRTGPSLFLTVVALLALASCAAPPGTAVRAPEREETLMQVWSTPSSARIILDGKPTGFRTPTSFPVGPGEHRVTLSLAGHRNAEVKVRLESGKPQRVGARLTPLASGGLSVSSLPAGAQIFVDGDSTNQRTPAVIGNLAVGTHTVELRRPGTEDWCQAVVVTPDRTLTIQAVLSPSRSSLGALSVRSQPPRASISIDGHPTGRVTPGHFTGVPAGSHRVELVLEGYRSWSGTALVREGQTENLLVALRHLPAQEVGGARIETDPPGATITLNGVVQRQKTPADLTGLAPGTFTLTLSRPGSLTWQGEIVVEPGKTVGLEVPLEPQHAAP